MTPEAAKRLARAMSSTPVLVSTPAAAVVDLCARGALRRFQAGSYLFHQGDEAREVFFLRDGRIELSSFSASGTRGLHTAVEPPQFFGELGVLAGTANSSSAIAIEDSSVWCIAGSAFLGFLTEQPPAAVGLLRALARQVQEHEGLVDDLLFLDLKGRVAKRLLGLVVATFDEIPEDGAVVPSIVTHADLASLAGGSRENVSRILADLQRRKIVERQGKRYVLRDIAALRRLARLA